MLLSFTFAPPPFFLPLSLVHGWIINPRVCCVRTHVLTFCLSTPLSPPFHTCMLIFANMNTQIEKKCFVSILFYSEATVKVWAGAEVTPLGLVNLASFRVSMETLHQASLSQCINIQWIRVYNTLNQWNVMCSCVSLSVCLSIHIHAH